MIDKTSKEFMEGFIFQFPDFDDPDAQRAADQLQGSERLLRGVQEALRRGRVERGVVGIRLHHGSVVRCRDARPAAPSRKPVLAAMQEGGKGKHIFGEAEWWGKDLFGIDNALVGDWPVVVIEDGKAKIKAVPIHPRLVEQAQGPDDQAHDGAESDVLPAQLGLPSVRAGRTRAAFASLSGQRSSRRGRWWRASHAIEGVRIAERCR